MQMIRQTSLATFAILLTLCAAADLRAAMIGVMAERDATLIEDAQGRVANGSGPALFAGRNNAQPTRSRRRALVFFDVAAALPAGATVKRVELWLLLTPSNASVAEVSVHRVGSPWSEGPSDSSGGGGALARPGDATWLHTHFDTGLWITPGGDFAPEPSASIEVGSAGPYGWGSTRALVGDVQTWLDDPASNHGWLLLGDESAAQTAKRFASREDADESARPLLFIEYEIACRDAGLGPGAFGLCRAYCEALDCDGAEPRGSERACDRLARAFTRRTDGAPLPCE